MFEDINVLIDKRKLELKAPDAVLVRMLEDRDRFYGVFGELAYGLQSISRITWDLNEVDSDSYLQLPSHSEPVNK